MIISVTWLVIPMRAVLREYGNCSTASHEIHRHPSDHNLTLMVCRWLSPRYITQLTTATVCSKAPRPKASLASYPWPYLPTNEGVYLPVQSVD